MEEKFVIEGGHRLSGTVRPGGNKNEALPVLAATLLTDEEVILDNVPRIKDVLVMMDILRAVGAEAEFVDEHQVRVRARNVGTTELPPELCRRVRASILFAGPMVARAGGCKLAPPGGDVIGRRRLDTHVLALKELGASVAVNHGYKFDAPRLQGKDIFLDEPSVTATENAVSAAVRAKGTTILRNVACEPHVQGLCRMLCAMGAKIEGIGTNTLTIEGVERLGGTEHTVGSDYLEIGSLIGLAAVTRSELRIADARPEDLRMVRMVFEKLGIKLGFEGDVLCVPAEQSLTIETDLHGAVPRIDDAPWPAFPTDLMSIAITVATQCTGTVLFFEKMYEGRMFFVDRLISMGTRCILCDPHRVVVAGPAPLIGTRLESPDIRAGMALLIAAFAASGRSTIYNIRQIDRGYQQIDVKLRALGARIDRLPA
jgi:UDP-N-acetylglucosamine 1-carboxyvinyltransferase